MVETSRDVDEVYRIYGDNILECENFLDLLMENYEISRLRFEEKIGPIDRPLYLFFDEVREITTCLQMCAYYGGRGDDIDWTNNPLSNIFNEKVDVIITKVNDDHSESSPLLAIEYVNAIQAGNQGWQRSRRAINAAIHSIPYLFVLPMISWEPETDGLHLKSPRFLQAQSSFSQLVLCSKYGVPSLQIYQYSDMCDTAYREGYTLPENYRTYTGEDNVISIFSGILRKNYHPNETLYVFS